ncbi:MAG: FecR domain-containing protein [Acidobacteriota bacterium]
MSNQYKKFYVEWWKIQTRTIYGLVTLAVLVLVLSGMVWYASRHNWFVAADTAEMPKDSARIISFEGDVRITRAATRETIIVSKETFIAAGDTIQTQADGRAVVRMIDGSIYSVRPNSTVVIRDSSSIFGNKVRVSLDDGQLNVRTDKQPENSENVVEVAESENKLNAETDASFNADAQTSGGEIRISRGSVETTMGSDKTTLTENEFASVKNGAIASREKVFEPPKQVSPENSGQISDSTGAGVTVSFSWQDTGESAVSYYLQIAKSPYFANDTVLVDRSGLTSRNFKLAGMVPGTYYWRIKSTAKSGQTTNWNDPWRFTVIKGGTGHGIDVADWRSEPIGGGVYFISGRTQPGVKVRSQGRETIAGSDGSFKLQILSHAAVAAIEIADDRGNHSGFILSLANATVARRY